MPRDQIMGLIGDGPIGSKHDARHAAIAHKIERLLEGKPHLNPVDNGIDK
jgi:hypothetical protein